MATQQCFWPKAVSIGVAVFGLALHKPADASAGSSPELRGAYLSAVGNCIGCHTVPGRGDYAGGRPFHTDFGTIHSTNITPDPEYGIGAWTYEDFVRAMRSGVNAQGQHLYPVFPYPYFAALEDDDLEALYVYLQSVSPVRGVAPENDLRFPYNQRWLMRFWNLLFLRTTPAPGAAMAQDPVARGEYLVEAVAHCGVCHSPRNALGAQNARQALSGGVLNYEVARGRVRRWSASNLTPARSGLAAWSEQDLVDYLGTGHSARAGSFGPMNDVIWHGTRHMTEEDLAAMAAYLAALDPIERSREYTLSADEQRRGQTLYGIHCGTCHMPTGLGSTPGSELGPPLVGSSVVQAPDPATLINVILYGAEVLPGSPSTGWQNMKPLGTTLRNEQVADIATFVRNSWGNRGGPVTTEDVARQR